MKPVEWIVCERTGRWAAALRTTLDRSGWPPPSWPRLFEVRQLGKLAARLEVRPDSLALVEVPRASFANVLVWLAEAGRVYRQARFVALVDGAAWESQESPPVSRRRDRQPVVDALREAGASEVLTSPRQLQGLLALGRRHASLRVDRPDAPSAQTSIAAWAWRSLPWQEE